MIAEFIVELIIYDNSGKELSTFVLPPFDLTTPVCFPATTTAPTEPVPDLTDEKKKKEIELLGMTMGEKEKILIKQVYFTIFSEVDANGKKTYKIELISFYGGISTNTDFISKIWTDEPIFEFDNNYKYVDLIVDQVAIVPRYESLKNVKVEMINAIGNLEYFCKEFGIPYSFSNTALGKKIKAIQLMYTGDYNETTTWEEYADFYVRAFAEENRMTAADYTDPIPYTPRTPAP